MSTPEMSWTNERILQLIKLYEKEECLWNNNHEDHKCRSTINNSWSNISMALQTHPSEIRRKAKNLVSQFNREYRNLQTINKNRITERVSRWFAYEHLRFLLKGRRPEHNEVIIRNGNLYLSSKNRNFIYIENSDMDVSFNDYENNSLDVDIGCPNFELINVKSEITEEIQEDSDGKEKESSIEHIPTTSYPVSHNSKNSHFRNPRITKIIQRRNFEDKRRKELIRHIYKEKTRDECDIFGELVTCKLRRLDSFARNKVENLISNILWEASLGKFD